MADLISREALLEVETVLYDEDGFERSCVLSADIRRIPSVDAVSRGLFEQIKWERDVAMAQLEEHGIAFGAKKQGDVIVLPCKVGDEIYRIIKPSGECKPFVPTLPDKVEPFGICYRNVMGGYSLIPFDELGKTVFLTREEAEKALGERKEYEIDKC